PLPAGRGRHEDKNGRPGPAALAPRLPRGVVGARPARADARRVRDGAVRARGAPAHGGTLAPMPRLTIPVHMRWSDIDGYRHVNNARMLTLLEEARIAAFWDSVPGLDDTAAAREHAHSHDAHERAASA